MSSPRTRLTLALGAAATAALVLGQGAAPAVSAPSPAEPTAPIPHAGRPALNTGPLHVPASATSTPGAQGGPGAKAARKGRPALPAGVPKHGRYTFLVKLRTTSSLTTFTHSRAQGRSVRAAGQAATAQAATVASAQRRLVGTLPSKTTVLYKVHNVMAGVAVTTDVANYDKLASLPNVAAVYPVAPKTPSTSYAVPLQGGPAAWAQLPAGAAGQAGKGVRIADIDSGLDYTHADFGGPGDATGFGADGSQTAFQAASAASAQSRKPDPSWYDAAKFDAADSKDLVGDAYDADDPSSAPVSDPNPLDCATSRGGGHGTHTAGIAAGYGVSADGTTYRGPYDSDTISTADQDTWKIGPGMAPLATLISFRVFGCTGATAELSAGLDAAIGLNTDGNPDNDVNVVNLSVGSDYTPADDGDAIAAQDAEAAGINVVVASGNDDDVQDIGGSPGDAPQVLTVAASADAREVDDATKFTIASDPADGSLDGDHVGASTRSTGYAWGNPGEKTGAGDLPADTPLVTVASVDPTDPTACAAIKDSRHLLRGKIAVITDWDDANPLCPDGGGSDARAANVRAAGAVGFVIVSDRNSIGAEGLTGDLGADGLPDNGTPNGGGTDTTNSNDAIPGVMMVAGDTDPTTGQPTDGALLIKALKDGATVTITGTQANADAHTDATLDNSLTDFSSRGVHADGDVKPDVAAVGLTVSSADSGTGDGAISESGTSMATPMVAGLAALVVGEHGDKTTDNPYGGWTPEQVKADIMNTADTDVTAGGTAGGATYAPNRAGSGRIDAEKVLKNQVLAYNTSDKGTVSVSFGPVAVPVDYGAPYSVSKVVTVQNTGTTDEIYHVDYHALDSVPGVDYHLGFADNGDGTITVPAGAKRQITVSLQIPDPTKLEKSADASFWQRQPDDSDPNIAQGTVVDAAAGYPAEYLADASGNVVLTPSDDTVPTLRVPVYAAPRPTSDLSVSQKVALTSTGQGVITPTGSGLAQGGYDTPGAADTDTDPVNDIYSLGAGLELQAKSPALPHCSTAVTASVTTNCIALDEDNGVDLKAVGTTSDYPQLSAAGDEADAEVYFGIETYGANSTPAGLNDDDIYIDVDGDGQPDLLAFNDTLGYAEGQATPIYVVDVVSLQPDTYGETVAYTALDGRLGNVDAAVFDSDVLMLPVPIAALEAAGLKAGQPITYGIESFDEDTQAVVDRVGIGTDGSVAGGLTMNPFKPAVQVTEDGAGPVVDDQPNLAAPSRLKVAVNKSQVALDGGLGLMYLHFHNPVGDKVDIATFTSQSVKVSASGVTVGKASPVTVSVTGGSVTPTGTVTVKDGTTTIGTLRLPATTFSWTPTKGGAHTLTASYSGDANYAPDSGRLALSVAHAKPTISTKASTGTPKVGRTFTVKVTFKGISWLKPTGKVTLKLGTTSEGTKSFVNGTATFSVVAKKKGRQSLTARFAGDTAYLAVSAPTVSITAK